MPRIHDLLSADHKDLDRLFERLLEEVHARDDAAADRTWTEFERELQSHMSAEEKHILPVLAKGAPNEAAHIRADHDRIREALSSMGVSLELHTLPEEKVETFITLLRRHSAHEEESLYLFADRELAEEAKQSLTERIRKAIVDLGFGA